MCAEKMEIFSNVRKRVIYISFEAFILFLHKIYSVILAALPNSLNKTSL